MLVVRTFTCECSLGTKYLSLKHAKQVRTDKSKMIADITALEREKRFITSTEAYT